MPSLCDICPKPGNCCKKLELNTADPAANSQFSFWKDGAYEAAKAMLSEYGLPFEPLEIQFEAVDPDSGSTYVRYLYTCPELLPDGRCGIYQDRPQLCRDYLPGTDELCVFNNNGELREAA